MPNALQLCDNYTCPLRPYVSLRLGGDIGSIGEVGLYTRGAVYEYKHIGNHPMFVVKDVIKHGLDWKGYPLAHTLYAVERIDPLVVDHE